MEDISTTQLRRLHGQLGEIVYQLTRVQFSHLAPATTWLPPINAYRCSRQITICVDLAGVDKQAIEIRAEPRRLRIRGRREAPEPTGTEDLAQQVLAMEIDYGPFERELALPAEIETDRVKAEQRNGLLWVYLPLRTEA